MQNVGGRRCKKINIIEKETPYPIFKHLHPTRYIFNRTSKGQSNIFISHINRKQFNRTKNNPIEPKVIETKNTKKTPFYTFSRPFRDRNRDHKKRS